MNSHGLTRENLLKTLPIALRSDKSVVALADAVAQVLAQRPAEIDHLRIYPDIFRLDETMLDILAYDFKVDWWDGNYSLEEKRRTLRDNWNVHRTLGTKYAVETALGNIFPGAWTEEWFEYGGTPYCFRLTLPIMDGGVTAEKQRRVLSRIWYYKNLRSHLEGFQLNWEDTGQVRIGAYTAASHIVEIWPELVTGLEIAGQVGLSAASIEHQTMEVYPELPVQVEVTDAFGMSGLAAHMQSIAVFPELPVRVEMNSMEGIGAITKAEHALEIYPSLTDQLEILVESATDGAAATRQIVEIYPGAERNDES